MDAALSGPAGRVILGTTSLKIGRLLENQLVVSDLKASSRHAEIQPDGNGHVLVDLGSTNGTFVNEQRLIPEMPRRLKAGDVIRIGDTSYIYENQEQGGLPPTVYAGSGTPNNQPAYPPTVAAQGQEFPEYQAFSPVYTPPSQSNPMQSQQPGYPPQPQPGYAPPPPGYAAVSPGYPPVPGAQGPKKRRRGLWLALGIVGGLVLLLVISCVALLIVNTPTANKTLDAFCTDIKNKDGQGASLLFSDDILKNQANSVTAFVTVVNAGQISGCTHTPANITDQTATAQVILSISGASRTDNTHLAVDSNGNWRITLLAAAP